MEGMEGMEGTGRIVPVRFHDVSFGYGEERVLDSVSFDIEPETLTAVIGPNGGGKTTILKLILGLLSPDEGEVVLFGTTPEAARWRINYVPQYTLFDPLFPATVEDVVLMGRLGTGDYQSGGRGKKAAPTGILERLLSGTFRRKDRETGTRALETVGLAGLEKRPFTALSGGQRQRVLIARALAGEAELLMLDEPTSNVDRKAEKEIYQLLEILKQDKTIILVSHDTGVVSSLADSILCINRTLAHHPGCELTGEALGNLYGEGMQLVLHDRDSRPSRGEDGR